MICGGSVGSTVTAGPGVRDWHAEDDMKIVRVQRSRIGVTGGDLSLPASRRTSALVSARPVGGSVLSASIVRTLLALNSSQDHAISHRKMTPAPTPAAMVAAYSCPPLLASHVADAAAAMAPSLTPWRLSHSLRRSLIRSAAYWFFRGQLNGPTGWDIFVGHGGILLGWC